MNITNDMDWFEFYSSLSDEEQQALIKHVNEQLVDVSNGGLNVGEDESTTV